MIPALKAELRKLFTVRSTFLILLFALLMDVLFAGYISGYKLKGSELLDGTVLSNSITGSITAMAIFGAIVAVLLLAHEYRYNTILYSLTANRSRSVFLFAKIVAVTIFSLIFTALLCTFSPLITLLGVHLAGNSLGVQNIPFATDAWHVLFYGWGYSMLALLITALVRNQIGAIVSLFLIPSTVESLLGLIIKNNVVYLPFSALGAVIQHNSHISYGHAALVVLLYLLVGWAITWVMFLKRDAN